MAAAMMAGTTHEVPRETESGHRDGRITRSSARNASKDAAKLFLHQHQQDAAALHTNTLTPSEQPLALAREKHKRQAAEAPAGVNAGKRVCGKGGLVGAGEHAAEPAIPAVTSIKVPKAAKSAHISGGDSATAPAGSKKPVDRRKLKRGLEKSDLACDETLAPSGVAAAVPSSAASGLATGIIGGLVGGVEAVSHTVKRAAHSSIHKPSGVAAAAAAAGATGGVSAVERSVPASSKYCSADRITLNSGTKPRLSGAQGQHLRDQEAPAATPVEEAPPATRVAALSDIYAGEIYDHMRATENDYMKFSELQGEVTPRMRSILIDWMIEVQVNFSLVQETLYLAVNILNRFISIEPIARERLQLVGAAALLVASKHEEIYPPEVLDFVYICADTYSREEILAMEGRILNTLEFRLCAPVSWHFLQHYVHVAELPQTTAVLAQYFLELTLQENAFRIAAPSHVAAAAMDMACRIAGGPGWNDQLAERLGYTPQEVFAYARVLNQLAASRPADLLNCRRKYSTSRFGRISRVPIGQYYRIAGPAGPAPTPQ